MALDPNILNQYKNLEWQLLLREDLGNAGKLADVKQNFDRIKATLDKAVQYEATLAQIPSQERALQNALQSFLNFCSSQLLGDSYTNVADKNAKAERVRSQEEQIITQLSPVLTYLQYADPLNDTKKQEIEKTQKDLEEKLKEVEVLTNKVKSSLDVSGKIAQQQEVQTYGNAFGDMAEKVNKKKAIQNVIAMYATLSVTVIIAMAFIWNKSFVVPEDGSFWKALWNQVIAQNALLKIFVISAGGYLTAHFSRNYSAEMNMYYTNKHRQMALDSHKRILESISRSERSESDVETHNAILVQVSKTMYETQDSGYLKQASNPVPTTQIIETMRPSSR